MKIDRALIKNIDWSLPGLALVICLIGVLNIYSAGYSLSYSALSQDPPYLKQFRWIMVGLVAMITAALIDYRILNRYAYVIYLGSILLLVLTFLIGKTSQGAQRWLVLGGLNVQPSEMIKLTLILALGRYFSDKRIPRGLGLREMVIPLCLVLLPVGLILKQPDLGTAMIVLLITGPVFLLRGINLKTLLAGSLGFLFILPFGWFFLKDYQRERLLNFFGPERDPLGSGYHIIQSIIAVGSGGLTGKGYLQGSQTQLKFLPEQQTDFIFSVLAEEWGFLGGVVVCFLFFILISKGIKIAYDARDILGSLIAFGVSLLIAWGVVINMGMVMGIVPVVGIPLPFLSYGGSAIVVSLFGVGLLMNINARRLSLKS